MEIYLARNLFFFVVSHPTFPGKLYAYYTRIVDLF